MNGGIMVQGATPVSTSTISSSVKPNYRIMPAYIYGCANVYNISESEKEAFSLGMLALNKQKWSEFTEIQKKEIINGHRFVYLKMKDKDEVMEIGMHVSDCKFIEELGLTRIMLGKELLPKDVPITAMSDQSYDITVKKIMNLLV